MESFLALDAKSCLLKVFRLIASLLCRQCQSITLLQRKTQAKLLDDIVADASATEILLTYSDAVGIVLQYLLEVFHRPLIDDKHRFAVALFLLLLVSQFLLLDLNIVFLCQPAKRLGVGNLFVLHEEVDGCSALATGKALADLLRRRHHERGRLVVVERTQALIVHARLPQRDHPPRPQCSWRP